ncbi:energy transducer TonB [Lewinella sp. W8]|uniref:energy transducer TonB n=1 Tax=Lewinella sp. W8 TaxID=2528208 RepID=UPI0010672FA2|nr:energy transducer TonB [Lewinella sp. W8]MTB50002.1 TonB family protein [Lewinella sp. W8]
MKTRSCLPLFLFLFVMSTGLAAQSGSDLLAELASGDVPTATVSAAIVPTYLLDRHPVLRPAERQEGLSLTPEFDYPELAREYGIEGRVTVRCIISAAGTVVQATVVKGIGYGCDAAAVEALLASQWTPAMKDGQLVATSCYVPVDFSLR